MNKTSLLLSTKALQAITSVTAKLFIVRVTVQINIESLSTSPNRHTHAFQQLGGLLCPSSRDSTSGADPTHSGRIAHSRNIQRWALPVSQSKRATTSPQRATRIRASAPGSPFAVNEVSQKNYSPRYDGKGRGRKSAH